MRRLGRADGATTLFPPAAGETEAAAPPTSPPRRPLDNPRVLVVAACLLVGILAGLLWFADQTNKIAPTVLSDVLLYALLGLDVVLLVVLLFVLARNLLKLWVEQRRALPFARFRWKLVAAMLLMTIVPAVLVLISGSQIIRDSALRWFSEPVDEVLNAAQQIARQYYVEHREAVTARAERLARALPIATLDSGDVTALNKLLEDERSTNNESMVELYRTVTTRGQPADLAFVAGVVGTALPKDPLTASADRLAARAVASGHDESMEDDLDSEGILVRSAVPILDATGVTVGAVVVSERLSADMRLHEREATYAYESYKGLSVLKVPIQGIYQSIFLTVTLLILISATWLGLYFAKRVTRPVQMLAEGARAIGAGQLDLRLEPETGDELGALVESFNMMAAELRSSREKVDESRRGLQQKSLEVDARRRYIETILERVAAGVISLDAEGRISTVNGAAERLLGLGAESVGRPAADMFRQHDLAALVALVEATNRAPGGVVQEITLTQDDRETHMAAAATALVGDDGQREGTVLVLDDVTPLIRAQRVAAWRDVARRLAHEIKNPLTPIQLSAERLRRHFAGAPAQTSGLVTECTDAIVAEVESLKGLVDEFAQFARLRGPRMLPLNFNRVIEDSLQLYAGVLQASRLRLERRFEPTLPPVRLDAEQIRQVIINLVDNAMEALGGPLAGPRPDGSPPTIVVQTAHDVANGVVRLIVSDNGPGVPPGDRDKLFMPYYSTKGRGSGLGLAIVRRIVVEHGGAIDVSASSPSGTTFTVDLPEVAETVLRVVHSDR